MKVENLEIQYKDDPELDALAERLEELCPGPIRKCVFATNRHWWARTWQFDAEIRSESVTEADDRAVYFTTSLHVITDPVDVSHPSIVARFLRWIWDVTSKGRSRFKWAFRRVSR